MTRVRYILPLFLLLFLSSCIPSLPDTVKIEGGTGQGVGGSSCTVLADLLKIPPDDRLERRIGSSSEMYGPVSYILEFVETKLSSATQEIFSAMNDDGAIDTLLGAIFTLYIAIYGISLLMGLVKAAPYEIIMTILKMSIIYELSTNYGTYASFVQDVVEDGGKELMNIGAGAFSDNSTDLQWADDVVSTLLSFNMVKLIFVLFSPEIGAGWLYGLIFVAFIWFFISALLRSLYLVIVAMIIRSVLLGLAPIFLPAIMFRKTRSYFDGWIKQVMNFTLMPVILFTFLGFFYSLIQYFIEKLQSTPAGQTPEPICYNKAYPMPGNITEWSALAFGNPGKKLYGLDAEMPIDLAPILVLVVIAYVMRQMVDWAEKLSGYLTQAYTSFSGPASPKQLIRQLGAVSKRASQKEASDQAVKRAQVGGGPQTG